MDPAQLKYAKTHEWVALDGDIATIGISDFAVGQLTDLVYIELPPVGRSFNEREGFGVVESVKAVSDLYAPVAGEIVEANTALENDLSILSSDPFGKGWMIKLKVAHPAAVAQLMDQDAYKQHCALEAH